MIIPTARLRGRMEAGFSRMNSLVVIQASQVSLIDGVFTIIC